MPTTTVIVNGGKAICANRMLGSGTEPKYAHWGTTSGVTAAATQTALDGPGTEARVAGVSDRTTASGSSVTNDSYRVVAAIVADGAKTIYNAGLFDAAGTGSPPSGGTLFMKSSFDAINLGAAGEGVQLTFLARFT